MAAEQDKFRDWLKSQPPEEILKHTYEYTVREDILMAMEELDLPQSRAAALLASPSPLADVYKEFADRETSYMDVVRDSIEQRAEAALDAQRELPLYRHDAAYAREQGDLDLYRASRRANIACKEAIEASISEHYRDNRLDKDAVPQVIEQFGYTRTLYVLANTVQQKEWDERFSPANKTWARTVDIPPNPDGFGGERNLDFVVDSHSGLVDLFLSQARQDYLRLQPLTPEEIHAEAARLLQELRAPDTPNSPHGTHYMARVSPDFLARAGTQAHDQLMALLPFRSLAITGMKDLPGTYVTILASEDRSKELRQRRPSVRRQLKQEPRPAEKPEKKSPIHKKRSRNGERPQAQAGVQLNFRVSPEELALIEQKMAQLGTKNREAYLRKMALDGYVVRLELPELKELVSLMRYSSNNLNQLARRAHETGRIYDADLEDITRRQEALWDGVHQVLTQLVKLS